MPVTNPTRCTRERAGHKTDRFEKLLADYLVTATATGVGLLALAQTADAKIVYTATNQLIKNETFSIDIHNGTNVEFRIMANTDTLSGGQVVTAQGAGSTNEIAMGQHLRFPLKFNQGSSIGSNSKIVWKKGRGTLATTYNGQHHGYWPSAQGYLGLRITLDGQWHYGWARLNVQAGEAFLSGYAYETAANEPIHAGQTSGDAEGGMRMRSGPSLGALALGAPGLVLWRREEPVAGAPSA
jgi:hypothetical protein